MKKILIKLAMFFITKPEYVLRFFLLTVLLTLIVILNSCMSVKTNVGSFKEKQGKEYTYSKSKQVFYFWGVIPAGRTTVSTPSDGQCQIIVRQNGSDIIIQALTGGFFKSRTVKVIAKK
jgi:hypothetical protein